MKKLRLLFLCLLYFSCNSQEKQKINGISFVASGEKALQAHVNPVLEINANYAAIMPFGFMRSLDSPTITFNTDKQWFGETKGGAKQYIQLLQKNGIKIMVKPQIWIWRGEFTGHMVMQSEEKWKTLESSYADFILTYAMLAEETNAEIYCIGTELGAFIKNRPEFWSKLIVEVKKVYKGKLTYAANWDEYARTPFWRQLDFIGVDAYFPLSEERHPTIAELSEGWQKWKTGLKNIAKQNKKPILFTEFGYRSKDFTANKPWLSNRGETKVNLGAQTDATKAIFNEFWEEDWFAGGFVWKWFIHHERSGGTQNDRFTPQNKPAETVIKEHYADY